MVRARPGIGALSPLPTLVKLTLRTGRGEASYLAPSARTDRLAMKAVLQNPGRAPIRRRRSDGVVGQSDRVWHDEYGADFAVVPPHTDAPELRCASLRKAGVAVTWESQLHADASCST